MSGQYAEYPQSEDKIITSETREEEEKVEEVSEEAGKEIVEDTSKEVKTINVQLSKRKHKYLKYKQMKEIDADFNISVKFDEID